MSRPYTGVILVILGALACMSCDGVLATSKSEIVENHCADHPLSMERDDRIGGGSDRLQRYEHFDIDPEDSMPTSVKTKASSADRDKIVIGGVIEGSYWNVPRFAFHFALWGWIVPINLVAEQIRRRRGRRFPKWVPKLVVGMWFVAVIGTGLLSGSRAYLVNQTAGPVVVRIDEGEPIAIEPMHTRIVRFPIGVSSFEVRDIHDKIIERVDVSPDSGPSYRRMLTGSPRFVYAVCGVGTATSYSQHYGP